MEEKIIYRGCLYDDFNGFDEGNIFKTDNGNYWIQIDYKYDYSYSYRPDVIITYKNGEYILTIDKESVIVRPVYNVIESSIDGEFSGWDDNKIYKLRNGQIWKQSEYKYEYKYSYSPNVIIYENIMCVEDTKCRVERLR